jgi:exonuclease III
MINFVLSSQKHDSRVIIKSPPSSWKNITLLAILLAGDIQLNPGPSVYPCGYCEIPVTWEHKRAICCDEYNIWYHSDCFDLNASELNNLQKDNVSWICCKCDTQNAGSFTYHPYELETSNQFSAHGSVSSAASMSTIPSINSSFSPSVFISTSTTMSNESISERSNSVSGIQKKDQNFRILMMNCQSIRNKGSELHECVEYIKPDAINGCESWLSKEHKNAEIFPDGHNKNVFRKDRNKYGGGVFIALHDKCITSTVENTENDCELQWAEIQTKNKSVIIGSYYRPPNSNLDALNNLNSSIANVREHSKDKPIILAGDYNLPHIDCENNTEKTGSNQVNHHQELIEIIEDSGMEQLQLKPSRENYILDLFLTNQPSLVKSCNTIPGISDHNMIIVDTDLKTRYNKPKRREINIFKKASWDQIKTDIIALGTRIIQSKTSVEEKWTELKNGINNTLVLNVPKKLTPNRHNLPWLSNKGMKMIRKKHQLF